MDPGSVERTGPKDDQPKLFSGGPFAGLASDPENSFIITFLKGL
jgi:hypothetical protein